MTRLKNGFEAKSFLPVFEVSVGSVLVIANLGMLSNSKAHLVTRPTFVGSLFTLACCRLVRLSVCLLVGCPDFLSRYSPGTIDELVIQ